MQFSFFLINFLNAFLCVCVFLFAFCHLTVGSVYILKIFRTINLEMQTESMPTLSMVVPGIDLIFKHLTSEPAERKVDVGFVPPFDKWGLFPISCQNLRKEILSSCEKRLLPLITPEACVATLLDSRFASASKHFSVEFYEKVCILAIV